MTSISINDDLFESEEVYTMADGQVSGRCPQKSNMSDSKSKTNKSTRSSVHGLEVSPRVFYAKFTDSDSDDEIPEEIEIIGEHKQQNSNTAPAHHSDVEDRVSEMSKRVVNEQGRPFRTVDVVTKIEVNSANDGNKGFNIIHEATISGTKCGIIGSVIKQDIVPEGTDTKVGQENKLASMTGSLNPSIYLSTNKEKLTKERFENSPEAEETASNEYIQSTKKMDAKNIPVKIDQHSQNNDSSLDRDIECQPKEKIHSSSKECSKTASGEDSNKQVTNTNQFRDYITGRNSYDFSSWGEIIKPLDSLSPIISADNSSKQNNNQGCNGGQHGHFQNKVNKQTIREKSQSDHGARPKEKTSEKKPIRKSLSENALIRETETMADKILHHQIGPKIGTFEHLWRLLETGCISVPNYVDIKLMEKYFIASTDDRIIKKCRISDEIIDSVKLKGAGKMCCIKQSARIAVIQTPSCISCLETHPRLSVVYRIDMKHQYDSICHLETYANCGDGLPNPMHVFATAYTKQREGSGDWTECVMRVKPKRDVYQGRYPVYNEDASEIQLPHVSKIHSLNSVWRGGIHLIVGCNDSVACIRVKDKYTVWKTSLKHSATDVTFMDPNILVCVQDEHRIAAIDYNTGNEVIKNIFITTDDKTVSPHRLSVCGDTVLVKSFSNDALRMLTISEHTQKHGLGMVKKEHTILK